MFGKVFDNQPLLRHFCDFVPASDLLSLFDCNKSLHTFAEGLKNDFYFTKRVQIALKKAINCEKVYNALLAAPVNISGSFMLWALNGGNWNPGDIDIFIDEDLRDSVRMKNFRKSLDYAIPMNNRYEFAPEEENNTFIKNVCTVQYTDDDKKEKTHLQLIYCDNALKTIKNFDLNFLKNIYNPKLGFTIQHKENFMKRESVPKIEYDKNKTPDKEWFNKILERAKKYTKRGYNCFLKTEKLSCIKYKYCGDKIVTFSCDSDLEPFVPTQVRNLPIYFTNTLLQYMKQHDECMLRSIKKSIDMWLIRPLKAKKKAIVDFSDDEKEDSYDDNEGLKYFL